MDIVYLGHASFRLKGKLGAVAMDPYGGDFGKYPKDIQADILTVSHGHPDHNDIKNVEAGFLIDGPGEYEVKGISIVGVASFHDDQNGAERGTNTIYVVEMDGLRVAHLGDLGHKLTQAQLDEMGNVDILLIPVGGVYTIDAKTAVEVVKQIDPWVVIPMHYHQAGIVLPATLAGVEDFLKEIGKTEIVPVAKYSISADKLPTELTVVVMEKK